MRVFANPSKPTAMETIALLILAIGIGAYLLLAMLHPEKF